MVPDAQAGRDEPASRRPRRAATSRRVGGRRGAASCTRPEALRASLPPFFGAERRAAAAGQGGRPACRGRSRGAAAASARLSCACRAAGKWRAACRASSAQRLRETACSIRRDRARKLVPALAGLPRLRAPARSRRRCAAAASAATRRRPLAGEPTVRTPSALRGRWCCELLEPMMRQWLDRTCRAWWKAAARGDERRAAPQAVTDRPSKP